MDDASIKCNGGFSIFTRLAGGLLITVLVLCTQVDAFTTSTKGDKGFLAGLVRICVHINSNLNKFQDVKLLSTYVNFYITLQTVFVLQIALQNSHKVAASNWKSYKIIVNFPTLFGRSWCNLENILGLKAGLRHSIKPSIQCKIIFIAMALDSIRLGLNSPKLR